MLFSNMFECLLGAWQYASVLGLASVSSVSLDL